MEGLRAISNPLQMPVSRAKEMRVAKAATDRFMAMKGPGYSSKAT
jgi:hypothetical protein